MLYYAIINKKYKSADQLILALKGKKILRGRNQMTALSASVIEPNFMYFEMLVNWENNQVDLHEELVVVKRMKRSFISYLCKMHRKYEGQN